MKLQNYELFSTLQEVCNFTALDDDMVQIIEAVKRDYQLQFLNDLSRQFHERSKSKGFWDEKRETGTLLMLVVSELSEALEADRKDKNADTSEIDKFYADGYTEEDSPISFASYFKRGVKDTFEDEIADTFIRLFDLCGAMNIDIAEHIELKMKYNATREHKHGKKY